MPYNFKSNWESQNKDELLKLSDGSRIGVIGGGPAGSFFSYFLLDMAERVGIKLSVDVYEPRDFNQYSPRGCNMCGGIISETLVQMLATEGINLPPTVVQRGLESYTLHTDRGTVSIETPLHEKRIAAVHRGMGPRNLREIKWGSFDAYLQVLAIEKGANLLQQKVTRVSFSNGLPEIITDGTSGKTYDLTVAATGINSKVMKSFTELGVGYLPPRSVKTVIREFYLGEEIISHHFGNAMHIFLLDLPEVEFAAFIPKGDYVTFCMLGTHITQQVIDQFMETPEVKNTLPENMYKDMLSCHCNPKIAVTAAKNAFADRMVFIGDCGVTRLYKDGIGAAYRTAKAAASTAIFQGISEEDFKKYFWPACKNLDNDNKIGKLIFMITRINQKVAIARSAMLKMVAEEQSGKVSGNTMSTVLWDMFTGSASYKEIFLLTLHPLFLFRYLYHIVGSLVRVKTTH